MGCNMKTSFGNPYTLEWSSQRKDSITKTTYAIVEMVIWDTQHIRTRRVQLTVKGANSIDHRT